MAKAIYGHLAGYDPRLGEEARRLRLRVAELLVEVERLRAENDALGAALAEVEPLLEPLPRREVVLA